MAANWIDEDQIFTPPESDGKKAALSLPAGPDSVPQILRWWRFVTRCVAKGELTCEQGRLLFDGLKKQLVILRDHASREGDDGEESPVENPLCKIPRKSIAEIRATEVTPEVEAEFLRRARLIDPDFMLEDDETEPTDKT